MEKDWVLCIFQILLKTYISWEAYMWESFGHLMRREDSLERTLMLGKCDGKRRRGRQRMRWLDSVCEATNMKLTQLWESVEDRRAWRALGHGVTKSRARLNNAAAAFTAYIQNGVNCGTQK